MQTSLGHIPHVQAADVAFHETVLALSHKRIAESIARSLFERAREGSRYSLDVPGRVPRADPL